MRSCSCKSRVEKVAISIDRLQLILWLTHTLSKPPSIAQQVASHVQTMFSHFSATTDNGKSLGKSSLVMQDWLIQLCMSYLAVHHHWINPQNILWEVRTATYLIFFYCCHIVRCTCVFPHFCNFASFSVSLHLIWQPGSLINIDVTLRTMRSDQVVLTLFTFEIFKQCNQMSVAIDNVRF